MSNNIFSEFKEFDISYLPDQSSSILSWEADDQDETALIPKGTDEDYNFFILNGDHREAYSKCSSYVEAKKYFEDNTHLKSNYSD